SRSAAIRRPRPAVRPHPGTPRLPRARSFPPSLPPPPNQGSALVNARRGVIGPILLDAAGGRGEGGPKQSLISGAPVARSIPPRQPKSTHGSPSSRGLGHRPFTAATPVRIRLGTPNVLASRNRQFVRRSLQRGGRG